MQNETALCYHCAAPIAAGTGPAAVLDRVERSFCCEGCLAIATTFHSAGLQRFYVEGTRFAKPVGGAARAVLAGVWDTYNLDDLIARYTRPLADGTREAILVLEDLRCAACVWLIERHLAASPATGGFIRSAVVNASTGRLLVRYDPQAGRFSDLFRMLADIGHTAWPYEPSESERLAARERRGLLFKLGVASLSMMQVMMYAWPVYAHDGAIDAREAALMRWTSLILTLPVVFYSALPMMRGAWRSVRTARVGMDVPVAISILLAFTASTFATVRGFGETYFDSIAMFVTFLLAARYLELRARQSARSSAEELARQIPAVCRRLPDHPDPHTEAVAVSRVGIGDVLSVDPGEVFAVDGVIVEGATEVDESLLTGESRLILRRAADPVLAGSVNAAGTVLVRTMRIGAATRLGQIVDLLDASLAARPRIIGVAERFAAWFTTALLALSALTGLVWSRIDPDRALETAIAVLVVSCPCALALATPAAMAAATGALARRGLLVVRAHLLETLCRVTDVVLDKTGTLTEGRFSVARIDPLGSLSADDCRTLASLMEREETSPACPTHPIGRALQTSSAGSTSSFDAAAMRIEHLPSRGIRGWLGEHEYRLGSRAFAGAWADAPAGGASVVALEGPADGNDEHCSAVYLSRDREPLARFLLSDALRSEAKPLLALLAGAGVNAHLLSGDSATSVGHCAREVGIDRAVAEASPEDKRRYVEALQAEGAVVLAIGDGINDAPLLAQAQVSVAIASGAPLAQASADALLTHDRLSEIAEALRFSKKVSRVVRQNLVWAASYNLIAIPAAALGWVSPWLAGIGMSLSSMLVVANALRLSRV